MKEIKFRAWDGQDTMIYFNFNSIKHDGLIDWNENKYSDTGGGLYIDNCDVMQYTGLQDKTGRNIYEGDIVIASKMPYYWEFVKSVNKGLVVYNNHTASYRIKMDNYHSSTIGESDTVKFNPVSKYEVIGNIYENPELLDIK